MNSRRHDLFRSIARPLCPFPGCPSANEGPSSRACVRFGSFLRRDDCRRIPRFRCRRCGRTFSRSTLHPHFRQKARRSHAPLRILLSSGVSLRRSAKIAGVARSTVARKLRLLGRDAILAHASWSEARAAPLEQIQFDELETFEHSRLKPLSVGLAVSADSREILAIEVARMPAKGPLAGKARRRYGHRPDERPKAIRRLLAELRPWVADGTRLRSDSHPFYPSAARACLPRAIHLREASRSACVTGQGELKKGRWDPLFSVNHTCAMLRANLSRLIRKTWCTTKRPDSLRFHLALYARYHNTQIEAARQQQRSRPALRRPRAA